MDRRHQLAFGGEGYFANRLEAPVKRFIFETSLARRNHERAFRRVALDYPAAVTLLQLGVVGAVAHSEGALQLDSQRTLDRSRPVGLTSPAGA